MGNCFIFNFQKLKEDKEKDIKDGVDNKEDKEKDIKDGVGDKEDKEDDISLEDIIEIYNKNNNISFEKPNKYSFVRKNCIINIPKI